MHVIFMTITSGIACLVLGWAIAELTLLGLYVHEKAQEEDDDV